MASAAVKPMEQMEELKQILIDLKQNTGVQVVNMVQESFKTMDAQRQVLQQELQDVKAQLNAMQETLNSLNQQPQLPVNYVIQVKNNHSIMKGLAEGLEKSISGLGKHIARMKKSMGEKATKIVKDFKAHGVIALNNIFQKLGIKEFYKTGEQYYSDEAHKAKAPIDKLNAINMEINKTKTHFVNIGRAVLGGELKTASEKQSRLLEALKAPYTKRLQSCQKESARCHKMVAKFEKLEQQAVKSKSVLGKIDKFSNVKAEEQESHHGLDMKQTHETEAQQHKRNDRSER